MKGDTTEFLAHALRRRGLAAPARLLLDAHRPIAPLIGDAVTLFRPLLAGFAGRRASDVVELFERDDGIDELIERLDAEEAECRTSRN